MTFDLLYSFITRAQARHPFGVNGRFDPCEPRRYGGVGASDLSVAARDRAAMDEGRKAPGLAARAAQYSQNFLKALSDYICVKAALRLWERPLQEGYRPRAAPQARQRRHWFWRTPPPTKAEWAARTARYGFDIRATSPIYIQRAVYKERAKLRAALAGPLAEGSVSAACDVPDFIGPPAPRDYKDPDDFLRVWPPVFIGGQVKTRGKERSYSSPVHGGGAGAKRKRRGACDVAPRSGGKMCVQPAPSERRALSQTASPTSPAKRGRHEIVPAANLLSQYHWAVAQYGESAGAAFAASLSPDDQSVLEIMLAKAPP